MKIPAPRTLRPADAAAALLTAAALSLGAAELVAQTVPGTDPCPQERADPDPPLCPGNYTRCEGQIANCPPMFIEVDGEQIRTAGCDSITGEYAQPVPKTCTGYPPPPDGEEKPRTECKNGKEYKTCSVTRACRQTSEGCWPFGGNCTTTETTVYKVTEACAPAADDEEEDEELPGP